ncbi:hypothetical protein HAX54_033944 [Datura stramonium]|uniref:Uncharacterized protein n=1 Tax=Datura stramonium TaxID=4076 RepID=A0ABS8VFG1_DATST|nr:hypothetical protein [Datura stramonium]
MDNPPTNPINNVLKRELPCWNNRKAPDEPFEKIGEETSLVKLFPLKPSYSPKTIVRLWKNLGLITTAGDDFDLGVNHHCKYLKPADRVATSTVCDSSLYAGQHNGPDIATKYGRDKFSFSPTLLDKIIQRNNMRWYGGSIYVNEDEDNNSSTGNVWPCLIGRHSESQALINGVR